MRTHNGGSGSGDRWMFILVAIAALVAALLYAKGH